MVRGRTIEKFIKFNIIVTCMPCFRLIQGLTAFRLYSMASIAAGRPPSLSSTAVTKLVKKFFRFQDVDEQSVKQFPSYDDRNFYFRGIPELAVADGKGSVNQLEEYVLKLSNPLFTSYEALEGTNALLNHLHANGFTRCIRPKVSREGADLLEITEEKLLECDSHLKVSEKRNKSTFFMRVVSFIPGECLDEVDKHHLTLRLLYDVGHCIGSADAILQVCVSIRPQQFNILFLIHSLH